MKSFKEKFEKKSEHRGSLGAVFGVVLVSILVVAGIAAGVIVKQIYGTVPIIDDWVPTIDDGPFMHQRAVDGVEVPVNQLRFPLLAAVMIDNHPEARPSAGLAHATVVYEVPVEGVFTRYLALYPMSTVTTTTLLVEQEGGEAENIVTSTYPYGFYSGPIGPVRSARPYYLDIAAEYDAIYSHVGGSPASLTQLRNGKIDNLNQFFTGDVFWRSNDRWAPHNVMTTPLRLAEGVIDYFDGRNESKFVSWSWVDIEATKDFEPEVFVPVLTIDWKDKTNFVEWEFDFEAERYDRYRGGKRHRDADGTAIVADTIVIQHVDTSVIDSYGRLAIDLIGEGEVEIWHNGGEGVKGRWIKDARAGRTMFETDSGDPIHLRSGKIWVEIVPEGVDVEGVFQRE